MTQPRTLAVIPARIGSSRFAGKILHPVNGQPLLYHVWRQVQKAKEINRIVVATDSREIATAAEAFGAEVVMTSRTARSGSDRVAEAAAQLPGDLIVNVQGDNLILSPKAIDRVLQAMKADRQIKYATLIRPLVADSELNDPGVVKVVTAGNLALWFSRSPVPYLQKAGPGKKIKQFKFFGHIGIYFFRRRGLEQFAAWKRGKLEKAESLEQLRLLENGAKVWVFRTNSRAVSIDRPADLKKMAAFTK